MGLLQNITIYTQYPLDCTGGVAGSERSAWNRNEFHCNKYAGQGGISPKSASPNGYIHPHSYLWARSAGGMAIYKGILAEGDITNGNLAGGKNAEITISGNGLIYNAALGLITSALADLSGSAILDADIIGTLQATANLIASGNIEGALGALAGAICDIIGSGTVFVDIFANGNISADMIPYTTLSPQNLAASVWNTLAADFNTASTMGQKLNSAASAGDPWITELPGTYTGIQAGKLIDLIKTQVDSLTGGGSTGGGSEFISSQLNHISSNLGSSDTIDWVSSQIGNIPTSSQLGEWHGDGSWQESIEEGRGGSEYISSQLDFISSQRIEIDWTTLNKTPKAM